MGTTSNYNSPPVIRPVEDSVDRPLWSVMIPAYNCYNTLGETITSVLMQAPGKDQMQIEVVDDGSTDGDVKALVDELGKGGLNISAMKKIRAALPVSTHALTGQVAN